MRVTAGTKLATGEAIRSAAMGLFVKGGYQATSTREIAAAAGIATGTLFNYYASKEALALDLICDGLEKATAQWRDENANGSPEEVLFALIASGLRQLKPIRSAVGEVLEVGLSAFATAEASPAGAKIRESQLMAAREALLKCGIADPGVVHMHLYWTLYLGVMAYWARDVSPHQEDSLAMLDQAMRMFVGAIDGKGGQLNSKETLA